MTFRCSKIAFAFVMVWLGHAMSASAENPAPVTGAIFTTDSTGTVVDGNIYADCCDVFLNGGPGPNAPSFAAGLADGDYFFQVTDPSGKVLLSQTTLAARSFRVQGGVITQYPVPLTDLPAFAGERTNVLFNCESPNLPKGKDKPRPSEGNLSSTLSPLSHFSKPDDDEPAETIIQLMPFEETPNNGGVYKAWVTPVSCFDIETADQQTFGFVHRFSKTDNFKCGRKKLEMPELVLCKLVETGTCDCSFDDSDQPVPAYHFTVVKPTGETINVYTDSTGCTSPIFLEVGLTQKLIIIEKTGGMFGLCPQARVNGQLVNVEDFPGLGRGVSVEVNGTAGEKITVELLNQVLTRVTVCKFYDRDLDGQHDASESPIVGWRFRVMQGETVITDLTTGDNGCATIDLKAGTYTIIDCTPSLPEGSTACWANTTGNATKTITIDCLTLEEYDAIVAISDYDFPLDGPTIDVGNVCVEKRLVEFGTKGYWHNKNGLAELGLCGGADGVQGFVDEYVNGLAVYDAPTTYFEKGDEPFDGVFSNGDPVPAGKGVLGDEDIAAAGTVEAEVSNFLIDSNANGDPREQLAQQLLAFIFNTVCRAGTGDAFLCDDPSTSLSGLIDEAVDAWLTGTDAERTAIKNVLDGLNNNDGVENAPGVCLVFVPALDDCFQGEITWDCENPPGTVAQCLAD